MFEILNRIIAERGEVTVRLTKLTKLQPVRHGS
jgi:hypothetical protein